MIGQIYLRQPAIIGSVAGSVGVLLGLLVIFGWLSNSSALVQILPTFAPMQFNTAFCLLASGISLVMLSQERAMVSFWIACVVLLIASATMSQYIFNTDIGLDNLIIDHYITTNTSHPGRMAPTTALCFILFGLTAIFESLRTDNEEFCQTFYLSEFLSPFIVTLATMSLFSYMFKNDIAIAWANLTGMALHTTLGFIFLGVGLTCVIWNQYGTGDIRRSYWLCALTFYACIALDVSQPLGVAAGVVYVPAIFCSYWFRGAYSPFTLAAIATALTVIGYFMSAVGEVEIVYVIFNRILAVIAIWVTAFTIYSRKKSEQQLLSSQQALEASVREVEQFAYVASHDLRSPLRAISNLTQWLEEDLNDVLKDDTRENMDLLRGRVKRLDKLLDDILQFTKVGKFERKLSRVNIDLLLSNIQDFAHLRNDFVLDVKGAMPEVLAPEDTLDLVFSNLIDNAVSHHDKDTGTISVSFHETDEDYTFRVVDDGPGIVEEYRERVFDMFKKLEGRDETEGSGLGLSTVRKIVNLWGGRVWIDANENDRGICVSFVWPKLLL